MLGPQYRIRGGSCLCHAAIPGAAVRRLGRGLVAALFLVALSPGTALAAPPDLVRYQAQLTDDAGVPLSGDHNLVLSIHDAPSGGALLWSESRNEDLVAGAVDILLGEVNPLPPTVFAGPDRWLEVSVDGAELTPRQRLASLPFAHVAGRLDDHTLADVLDRSSHTGTQAPATISPQGEGSGLDADMLDGLHAAQLMGTDGMAIEVFTAAGSPHTWIAPPGVDLVLVTMVGGGGGGSGGRKRGGSDGAGGGGGGGGATVVDYLYPVVPGNSYTVSVGSGGAGAPGGSVDPRPPGQAGGDSSVTGGAAPLIVQGGAGGGAPNDNIGGSGGAGGGGNTLLGGMDGAGGIGGAGGARYVFAGGDGGKGQNASGVPSAGGGGGGSYFASGGGGGSAATGVNGTLGSGGGGGGTTPSGANAGGNGGDGIVILKHRKGV